ncbi:MAG: GcvT family protein, partial [Terracidiphilus sp.]
MGAGIIGCSVAYHLTKLGWKDVVMVEQNKVSAGTTWHAAGLVGRLRTSRSMTQVNDYSVRLYASLEAETGHPTGWKQVGSLIVARTKERMTQLRRTAAMAEYFGVEVEIIGAGQAREKWPLMRSEDLAGAAWLSGDGKVVPTETTIALAIGACRGGAALFEGVRVLKVLSENGRVAGVETNCGTVKADYVVLCAGMWTRQVGLASGVNVPLWPVEHHYVISDPVDGVGDDLPVGRDPDGAIYFRGEGKSILLGAFQKRAKPWKVEEVPENFAFQLLEADWKKFEVPLGEGRRRIPALVNTKIHRFINGPESFTPDNNFIIGEAPELRRLYVAAGFNSAGIASAGGAGQVLAEWIVAGEPPMDLWSVDIRRFSGLHNNIAFLRDRVAEALGLHYQMAWPNREFETGRDLKKSPLHDRLARKGACFGSKMGWERPLWFASGAMRPRIDYSFRRQNWFAQHAAEHHAARQNAAIFDQTSFSKFILKGPDAVRVLDRLCGNNMDVPVGKVVYTGLFNERGTFESDLTVVRFAEDRYYIVASTAEAARAFDWISNHVGQDEHAQLTDVSGAHGVLGVMGPRSREVLAKVTGADLSPGAFPYATAQQIAVAGSTVWAVRITYVGELGWELHTPMGQLTQVYDAIMEVGGQIGLIDAGHYAINSLRLEKGFRAWGVDISPDDTPLEAGLGFCVCWNKPVAFLGRDALVEQRKQGVG